MNVQNTKIIMGGLNKAISTYCYHTEKLAYIHMVNDMLDVFGILIVISLAIYLIHKGISSGVLVSS